MVDAKEFQKKYGVPLSEFNYRKYEGKQLDSSVKEVKKDNVGYSVNNTYKGNIFTGGSESDERQPSIDYTYKSSRNEITITTRDALGNEVKKEVVKPKDFVNSRERLEVYSQLTGSPISDRTVRVGDSTRPAKFFAELRRKSQNTPDSSGVEVINDISERVDVKKQQADQLNNRLNELRNQLKIASDAGRGKILLEAKEIRQKQRELGLIPYTRNEKYAMVTGRRLPEKNVVQESLKNNRNNLSMGSYSDLPEDDIDKRINRYLQKLENETISAIKNKDATIFIDNYNKAKNLIDKTKDKTAARSLLLIKYSAPKEIYKQLKDFKNIKFTKEEKINMVINSAKQLGGGVVAGIGLKILSKASPQTAAAVGVVYGAEYSKDVYKRYKNIKSKKGLVTEVIPELAGLGGLKAGDVSINMLSKNKGFMKTFKQETGFSRIPSQSKVDRITVEYFGKTYKNKPSEAKINQVLKGIKDPVVRKQVDYAVRASTLGRIKNPNMIERVFDRTKQPSLGKSVEGLIKKETYIPIGRFESINEKNLGALYKNNLFFGKGKVKRDVLFNKNALESVIGKKDAALIIGKSGYVLGKFNKKGELVGFKSLKNVGSNNLLLKVIKKDGQLYINQKKGSKVFSLTSDGKVGYQGKLKDSKPKLIKSEKVKLESFKEMLKSTNIEFLTPSERKFKIDKNGKFRFVSAKKTFKEFFKVVNGKIQPKVKGTWKFEGGKIKFIPEGQGKIKSYTVTDFKKKYDLKNIDGVSNLIKTLDEINKLPSLSEKIQGNIKVNEKRLKDIDIDITTLETEIRLSKSGEIGKRVELKNQIDNLKEQKVDILNRNKENLNQVKEFIDKKKLKGIDANIKLISKEIKKPKEKVKFEKIKEIKEPKKKYLTYEKQLKSDLKKYEKLYSTEKLGKVYYSEQIVKIKEELRLLKEPAKSKYTELSNAGKPRNFIEYKDRLKNEISELEKKYDENYKKYGKTQYGRDLSNQIKDLRRELMNYDIPIKLEPLTSKSKKYESLRDSKLKEIEQLEKLRDKSPLGKTYYQKKINEAKEFIKKLDEDIKVVNKKSYSFRDDIKKRETQLAVNSKRIKQLVNEFNNIKETGKPEDIELLKKIKSSEIDQLKGINKQLGQEILGIKRNNYPQLTEKEKLRLLKKGIDKKGYLSEIEIVKEQKKEQKELAKRKNKLNELENQAVSGQSLTLLKEPSSESKGIFVGNNQKTDKPIYISIENPESSMIISNPTFDEFRNNIVTQPSVSNFKNNLITNPSIINSFKNLPIINVGNERIFMLSNDNIQNLKYGSISILDTNGKLKIIPILEVPAKQREGIINLIKSGQKQDLFNDILIQQKQKQIIKTKIKLKEDFKFKPPFKRKLPKKPEIPNIPNRDKKENNILKKFKPLKKKKFKPKLRYTPTLAGLGLKAKRTTGSFTGFGIRGSIIKKPILVHKHKRRNLVNKNYVRRHHRAKTRHNTKTHKRRGFK